jgi:hypothetical protein
LRRTSPNCQNCCGKNEKGGLAAAPPHYGGLYAALQNRESQNTAGVRMAALDIDLAGDGLTICQATKAEIMTASANFIL